MANFTQASSDNGGYILGDDTSEEIAVAALAPAAGEDGVDILGYGGNDSIEGHAGHNFVDGGEGDDVVHAAGGDDFMRASAGADVLDGGAGHDVVEFYLGDLPGALSREVGPSGELLIKLDGSTVFSVTVADAAFIVTGVSGTPGAAFGTETVAGVEQLQFRSDGERLVLNLSASTYHDPEGTGGWIGGAITNELIDMAAVFPDVVASVDGSWAPGAGVNPDVGDDTVTGTPGADYVQASEGNDVIEGGQGFDVLHFRFQPGTHGVLTQGAGPSGELVIKLDDVVVATVAGSDNGAFTVAGVPGTAGAVFGTEVVSSVESLQFSCDDDFLDVRVGLSVYADTVRGGGWVGGSVVGDHIDLAAAFPGIVPGVDGAWTQGAGTDPGDGADTVVGTAGNDYILASGGADVIDGGAGNDRVVFELMPEYGYLTLATDSDGNLQVLQHDELIASIVPSGEGSYTITCSAGSSAEQFGTETLTNIESIRFVGLADELDLGLAKSVYRDAGGNGGWVSGSPATEHIDLAAEFPAIVAEAAGAQVPGAGVDPGAGNDTVDGTPGNDYFLANAGNDVIDGAGGFDELNFSMESDLLGSLSQQTDDNGGVTIKLGSVVIATVTTNDDGSFVVAGVAATPGEKFGTETVTHVERLSFGHMSTHIDGQPSAVQIALDRTIYHDTVYGGGWIGGSIAGENIDLAAEFPDIVGGSADAWAQGAGTDPGGGADSVTGSAGSDHFLASNGADSIDGGEGTDMLLFKIGDVAGKLTPGTDGSGNLVVRLDGAVIATMAVNGGGSFTITGMAGTAGEQFGTETVTNVENIYFRTYASGDGTWIDISLTRKTYRDTDGSGGWISGSAEAEQFDMAAEFPDIVAHSDGALVPGAGIDPGPGDDSVTGTAGNDFIQASVGGDTIDGGNGFDNLNFMLAPGTTGDLSLGLSDSGDLTIKLGTTVIATVTDNGAGAFIVTGMSGNAGEMFGTETVTNLERLTFSRQPANDAGSVVQISLAANVFHDTVNGGGWIVGSAADENIDMQATFPAIVASADGARVQGAGVDPGPGTDSVRGTEGDDFILASAGADTVDGGLGADTLKFEFHSEFLKLAQTVDDGGNLVVTLGGETIATIAANEGGRFTISGIAGTAGEQFGSETVTQLENLQFGNGDQVINIPLIKSIFRDAGGKGGWISGSVVAEHFDLAAEFPGIDTAGLPGTGAGVDPGAGNDTVEGTAGNDFILASLGDDLIDGAAGDDSLIFVLPFGSHGPLFQRLDGDGDLAIRLDTELIAVVKTNVDGSHTVVRAGTRGGDFGTETLVSVEHLVFQRQPHGQYDTGDILDVSLGLTVYPNSHDNGGLVAGSALSDVIDLKAVFPAVVSDGQDEVAVRPEAGNDTVNGTDGRDVIFASAGNDVIDGADGVDEVVFMLKEGVTGDLRLLEYSFRSVRVMLDSTVIATISQTDDGRFMIAGEGGTAGEFFGTETVRNTEFLTFRRMPEPSEDGINSVTVALTPFAYHGSNGAFLRGSLLGDDIDLIAAFPENAETGASTDPGLGDDRVTGTRGNDVIYASGGDDVIDGGAGRDHVIFEFDRTISGSLTLGTDELGYLAVLLDGTPIASIVGSDDSYIVYRNAAITNLEFHSENVSNVEYLVFSIYGMYPLRVGLEEIIYLSDQGWGVYDGTLRSDVIDLESEFPGFEGSADGLSGQGARSDPGAGNDTVIGTTGDDYVEASFGDDMFDGASGTDEIGFHLAGSSGTLTQGMDASGNVVVRLDGTIIATLTPGAGMVSITGMAGTVGEQFGTETLTNVEIVTFANQGNPLRMLFNKIAHHDSSGNGGDVEGSIFAESLNLGSEFPGIVPGTDGSEVEGAKTNPGNGNDTVIGTVGNDVIWASLGTDVIDGADGRDTLYVQLRGDAPGMLSQGVNLNGDLLIKMDRTVIATLSPNPDGSFVLAGMSGTAGEALGIETVTNVETLHIVTLNTPEHDGSELTINTGRYEDHSLSGPLLVGTVAGDTLDLAAEFPEIILGSGVQADPGMGDDTVKGTVADDALMASMGNDVIEGGDGVDSINFALPVGYGDSLSLGEYIGGAPSIALNGVVIATITRNGDGSFTIAGVSGTAGEFFGNETVSHVEHLNFYRDFWESPDAAPVSLDLVATISRGGTWWYDGTALSESIDLPATFPAANSASVIGVSPGAGDDTINGSVGSDLFKVSPGDDVFDGGAGRDLLELATTTAGVFAAAKDASGNLLVTLDDIAIASLVRQNNGDYVITGMPYSAGAEWGTETVRNVELVYFWNGSALDLNLTADNEYVVGSQTSSVEVFS